MALTFCYSCKTSVSTQAATCPNCHLKNPAQHEYHKQQDREKEGIRQHELSVNAEISHAIRQTERALLDYNFDCDDCHFSQSVSYWLKAYTCPRCGRRPVIRCEASTCFTAGASCAIKSTHWRPILTRPSNYFMATSSEPRWIAICASHLPGKCSSCQYEGHVGVDLAETTEYCIDQYFCKQRRNILQHTLKQQGRCVGCGKRLGFFRSFWTLRGYEDYCSRCEDGMIRASPPKDDDD